MKILFAAAECAPFFKTGGLGDVAGALPKELKRQGADIRVVLPYYVQQMPLEYQEELEDVTQFHVKIGWRNQYCGIKQLVKDNVTYYFIDSLYYFDRPGIYGFEDDGERFAFFSQAIIEMMEKINFIPDVLHVNDYHTAVIPVLMKDKYQWISSYEDIKTVLTIHNLQFQGIYDQYVLSDLFDIGYNAFTANGLEFYGNVNLLKGGIYYADLVTTVSPTYAKEIQKPEFGMGLEDVLTENNWKLRGILNGIDYDILNPKTDQLIAANFSVNQLEGKLKNKTTLQKSVGLPVKETVPLMAMVSRLTEQKGCHLLEEKMEELMQREIQVLILGTGESQFENSFRYFNERYPDKFKAVIDFNSVLAQQIYAGSDLYIMPSAFEPCGLSQLNALRYGTLPIVHETGGLRDTVQPYNAFTGEGTGFSFYDYTSQVMLKTIDLALSVYFDKPEEWQQLKQTAMKQDFSWEKSTQHYLDSYNHILNK
ncbi:MAG: glycogen synthase GlgA [Pisciglobus halotolerans]|nr:glycogen synthase GlgA [Pisciglobus halotolerans]